MSGEALRVLIVEDQFLIARQLGFIIANAGHVVVGMAATRQDACAMAGATRPDLAVVDVSLAEGSSGLDAARYLTDVCKAHVLFMTANRRRIPPDCCGAIGILEKPFTRSAVLSAIGYAAAYIREGSDDLPRPAGLELAPRRDPGRTSTQSPDRP